MSTAGLTTVSLPELRHLLRLVRDGALVVPFGEVALQAASLGHLWEYVSWLGNLDRPGLEAVLAAAIAERTMRPTSHLELVWTGPEAKVSAARDTAVVVRDLFERARRSVLVAGYTFYGGAEILEPLNRAMRERGVEVSIFLHVEEERFRAGEPGETAARAAIDFLEHNWPSGPCNPTLFYDPRTAEPGSRASLHAKCIVVDDRWALVGSANFTDRAHTRNIEVGVLIEDAAFASALAAQWHGLVESGLARPVHATPAPG